MLSVGDEITEEERREIMAKVEAAEARFNADPENVEVKLAMHEARLDAGWHEFVVETNSPADPAEYIPWVVKRRVEYVETWSEAHKKSYSSAIPIRAWLDGGSTTDVTEHHGTLDTDGQWRRKVERAMNVVAIEGLVHLRSLADRLGLGLIVEPTGKEGLPVLRVKDDRDY